MNNRFFIVSSETDLQHDGNDSIDESIVVSSVLHDSIRSMGSCYGDITVVPEDLIFRLSLGKNEFINYESATPLISINECEAVEYQRNGLPIVKAIIKGEYKYFVGDILQISMMNQEVPTPTISRINLKEFHEEGFSSRDISTHSGKTFSEEYPDSGDPYDEMEYADNFMEASIIQID